MKTVKIDGKKIATRDALHDLFQKKLDFPAYYGRNLDALFDILSTYNKEIKIVFLNEETLYESLGKYARIVRAVCEDAAQVNDKIQVDNKGENKTENKEESKEDKKTDNKE